MSSFDGASMVTVYGPSDRIIVLDNLGRAYVYVVTFDGSLRVVSEPDLTRETDGRPR